MVSKVFLPVVGDWGVTKLGKRHKVVAWLMAGSVMVLSWPALASAATVSQLQQQQQALQNQLSQARSQYNQATTAAAATLQQINQLAQHLDQTKSAMATTAQQLNAINASAQRTQALMAITQAQYNAVQQQYQVASAELAKTKQRLAQERILLTAQIRFMEEHGHVGYLSVVLGARNFPDFISRLYVLVQLAKQAGQTVLTVRSDEIQKTQEQAQLALEQQTLKARQAQLAEEQSLLASEEAKTAALQSQESIQAASYSQGIHQNQTLLAQLSQQERSAEASMTYLTQEINQVTAEVEALLAKFQGGSLTRKQLYQQLYPLVQPIATKFGLTPALVIAVITEESGGNEGAISSAGAIGLMQLEPGTAQELGIDPYNAYQNVVGGCTYLHQMLGYFNGSLSLALSAYNAGPGAVQNYLASHPGAQVLPYTVNYVDNILALYSQYQTFSP